ncbi:unnamed protein product [Arctia plantaginis]|uniref:Uncharacterized protein n=1 Tax=Arctia plantaginis TaxID=874455 RepID=A0A8S0ZVP1_ARCPL|nr:unnamed protein product [Arctia plantaginis]
MLTKMNKTIKKKHKTKEMKNQLSALYETTSKAIKRDYENYRNQIKEDNLQKYRRSRRADKQLTTHKNWILNLKRNTIETKSRDGVMNCATEFYKTLYEKKTDTSPGFNYYLFSQAA